MTVTGVTATGSNASGKFGAFSPTSVSVYSGTTNGNLVMVMLCVSGSVTAFTPPAGYSQLGSIEATSTGEYCGLFYHVWSAGDPTVVSFADNYAGSTERDYVTATYSGEDTTTPFDPSKTPSCPGNLSGATLTLAAVSPSGANDLLASFWAEANNSGGSATATYSAPLSQMTSYHLATSWNQNYVANGALSASGSTGSKGATFSLTPSGGVGFIIAIQPATGASPTPTATSSTATPTATVTATATATMSGGTATATSTPTLSMTATPTATGTPGGSGQDQYGGTTGVQCPNGPAAHFYTEKIGDRWWICDPAGNGFFFKGLTHVTFAQNTETEDLIVPNAGCSGSGTPWACCTGSGSGSCGGKYANTSINDAFLTAPNRTAANRWQYNWTIAQLERMQSWGFNSIADESIAPLFPTSNNGWNTPDQTLPAQFRMPFGAEVMPTTSYSFRNNNGCNAPSALKDMSKGTAPGFPAYPYNAGDYYDPNWPNCLSNLITPSNMPGIPTSSTVHDDYFVYITIDEDGEVGWTGPGPDFSSVNDDGTVGGNANSYHAAWLMLITSPSQSSSASYGVTYSDQETYSKVKLADLVATEYGAPDCTGNGTPFASCTGSGTAVHGSVDPSCSGTLPAYCMGDTYIGSAEMSNALGRLNAAWGSSYTTLSTADAHCTSNLHTCLSDGTYASWGSGGGLLDENGVAHGWLGDACTLGSNASTRACGSYLGATYAGETAAMLADMSAVLRTYAANYFKLLTGQWHTAVPGIMLMFDPAGLVIRRTGKFTRQSRQDRILTWCREQCRSTVPTAPTCKRGWILSRPIWATGR